MPVCRVPYSPKAFQVCSGPWIQGDVLLLEGLRFSEQNEWSKEEQDTALRTVVFAINQGL